MIAIHTMLFLFISFLSVTYMVTARSDMKHHEDGAYIKAAAGTISFILMLVAYLILLTIQTQVKEIL